jgi:vacuolar-type H+-ATPase subunit E/Vma4
MPSKDILDKLFDVERKAESLVEEAAAEAAKRVSAAKEAAEIAFKSGYEASAKEVEAKRAASASAADAEHDSDLAEFKSKLESARLDRAAFAAACERFISELS